MTLTRFVPFLMVLIGMSWPQAGQQPAAPSSPDSGVIGRVIDAVAGEPLPGAIVQLTPVQGATPTGSPNQRVVMTTDDGEFAFGPIEATSFNLSATMPGYLSGAYGRLRANGASQQLKFAEREIVEGVTIRMWRGASVSGTVFDEAGEPVVGLLVNVLRRNWTGGSAMWEVAGTPSTDDRGVYRMTALTPGEYTAYVPGARVSYPAGFRITAQTSAAQFGLQSYGTMMYPLVSGNPSGMQNLTDIFPAGSPSNERIGDFVTQTPQGARSISPASGTAGVQHTYPTTFAPGVPSITTARVVTLDAGQVAENIDIALRLVPAARVSGTVFGPEGPASNVVVRLGSVESSPDLPSNGFDTAIGVTDIAGRFVLSGVPAGNYVLKVAQGTNRFESVGPASAEQPVSIESADITGLAVTMAPALRVTGRVAFEGEPPAGFNADLMLRPPNAGNFLIAPQSGIAADRTIAMRVLPGRYAFFTRPRPGWYVKSAMLNGRDISAISVDITTDITDLVVTFTDTPSRVTGTVRGADGATDLQTAVLVFPVDTARVGDGATAGRSYQEAAPDRTGIYAVAGLAAGDYYIVAVPDAALAQPRSRKFLESLVKIADRVTVSDGTTLTRDLTTKEIR